MRLRLTDPRAYLFACGAAILAFTANIESEGDLPPPAHSHQQPFESQRADGEPVGTVQVIRDGEDIHVICDQKRLPIDSSLLFYLTTPGSEAKFVDVRYDFELLKHRVLRLKSVRIDTNLPPLAATANVEMDVLSKYKPRASVALEFELLIANWLPDGEREPRSQFMVRSRLVRFFDDGELSYVPRDRLSWLRGAPIVVGQGAPEEEATQLEVRPRLDQNWGYAISEAPETLSSWYAERVKASAEPWRVQVLVVAKGMYAPKPSKWPQQERATKAKSLQTGSEPSPSKKPGPIVLPEIRTRH